MSDTTLESLVRKADWTAVRIAEQEGPEAAERLEAFLEDPNRLVRLLTVNCIAAAGGPKAPALLVRALRDSDEQVQINAVNGLHRHLPSGRQQELLEIWDSLKGRDPYVRQQIPLVLGRIDDPGLIPELNRRADSAREAEVRESITASLSKLGEPAARERLAILLQESRNEKIADVMEYVRYIDDPWVLPLLRPVLERRETAHVLSTHRDSFVRRGCDLAVDEVLRISKAKFSFSVDPLAQYQDKQLSEVRRYLDTLKPKP